MSHANYDSISTIRLSTAELAVSSIAARTVSGDGANLSNLAWSNVAGTIPQEKYQAYSIPWSALEPSGSINIQSGTWQIGGDLTVNSLSVITKFVGSTIEAKYAMIRQVEFSSMNVGVISSIYHSTHSMDVDTIWFRTMYGRIFQTWSSFTSSIYTDTLRANFLAIESFEAQQANFSSLSVGTWTVDTLEVNQLSMKDLANDGFSNVILSNSTFYIGNKWLMDKVVYESSLISTTSNIFFNFNVLSNFLNPHPALSAMSSYVASSFQTLQITASTISTDSGSNFSVVTANLSNVSVGVENKFVALCNYTVNTISNVSVTTSARIGTVETDLITTSNAISNYFQGQTTELRTGISTATSNLSVATSLTITNLALSTGSNFTNLYSGVSSVGTIMAAGISSVFSTLSTVSGSNFSITQAFISIGLSNVSTVAWLNTNEVRLGVSSVGESLSTIVGSNFSVTQEAISTVSTAYGRDTSTLRRAVSTLWSSLSTISGSNFSITRIAISTTTSSLSTLLGWNTSTLSSVSFIGFSEIRDSISSSSSTFSTLIALNTSNIQIGLSSLSTALGSNTSTLQLSVSSLAGLLSTGLSTLSSQIQSTNNNLLSTVAGLGSIGYISDVTLRANLTSTVQGLGTSGYVSAPTLLFALTSTTAGLGTLDYISSSGLRSTVAGLGTLEYVSSLSLRSTVAGLGTSQYVSTTGLQLALTSTVAGLGASDYLSSASLQGFLRSTVEGLGTSGYVSTATQQASFLSTVAGLGSIGYISSASQQAAFTSTVEGLGSSDYISGTFLTYSLTSTVDNLGSLGYPSTTTVTALFNNAFAELGTLGYISTQSLSSTIRGLGSIGYISTGSLESTFISTTGGLGQLQYISTTQLISTVSGITNYISSFLSTAIANIPFQYAGTTLYFNQTNATGGPFAPLQTFETEGQDTTSSFTLTAATSNQYLMGFQTDFNLPNFLPDGPWEINLYNQTNDSGSNVTFYAELWLSNAGSSNLIATSSDSPAYSGLNLSNSKLIDLVPLCNLPDAGKILTLFYGNNAAGTSKSLTFFFENAHYSFIYTTFGTIFPSETINSTITGLGSIGYVSTLSLFSTVTGLGSLGFVSSSQLASTTQGLGQLYLSTPPLQLSVVSLFTSSITVFSTGVFQTLSTQAFFLSSVNGTAYGASFPQSQTITF